MRKYHSDNRNYNAILDAMATIRHNQLNENYMYEGEHEDEEMTEAESDEEEEQMAAVAEMMDEALMELDEEDDEDNLTEADDDRRSRRRARLRNAFLAGAGAAAIAGGVGAAGMGMLPGQFGQQTVQGALKGLKGAFGAAKSYGANQLDRAQDIAQRANYNRQQRAAVRSGAIDDFNTSPSAVMSPNALARRMQK